MDGDESTKGKGNREKEKRGKKAGRGFDMYFVAIIQVKFGHSCEEFAQTRVIEKSRICLRSCPTAVISPGMFETTL